jgi:hypothetical protein
MPFWISDQKWEMLVPLRHRKVKVARLDSALIFLFSGDVEMSYLPPGVHGSIS